MATANESAMQPEEVPVAWLGRTSTDDAQDPTLSLPRQLHRSRSVLPENWLIIAHYYDIESGRQDLERRGSGDAHLHIDVPIPREGGIQDLLADAARPDRPFAVVICESIDRVARRTYLGTKIEYELERSGVALWAADEPISTTPGRRATSTLTRRVKQAVAEWYVLQLLELSWDGTVEHTRQGWNIGKPPYGYLAQKVPHPVPAKRAEGRTKHRLTPHPVQGPAVTRIFELRVIGQLGYDRIADRLNQDLVANPPPEPTRAGDALGRWSATAVRDVLHNPKYTGHMVYNRRATKRGNRPNPPSQWIWSPTPVHEPLVTRECFDAATAIQTVYGTEPRQSGGQHTYLLRSYLYCALCGRRMWGKTQPNGRVYYLCAKDRRQHADYAWFAQHPGTLRVRASVVEGAVHQFLADHVSSAVRPSLPTAQAGWRRTIDASNGAFETHIADLRSRQSNLLQELEVLCLAALSPSDLSALRAGIYHRFLDLDAQIADLVLQRRGGAQERLAARSSRSGYTAALEGFASTVDAQRALYDACQLKIRYDPLTQAATVTASIDGVTASTTYQL